MLISDVDDGRSNSSADKQTRLSLGITLHAAVVVEMIAANIGQRGNLKPNAIDPVLSQRVRRNFSNDMSRARVGHFPQAPMHSDASGGGQGAWLQLAVQPKPQGTHVAGRMTQLIERLGDKKCGCRFAICAGNAGHRQ